MGKGEYTLITGGAGFVGSNLAMTLLAAGERVMVLDDLSRAGVENNLEWLRAEHAARLEVEIGDVADARLVRSLAKRATRIYHLAAQVAVTTSLVDPEKDLRSNLIGTFNVLEAARARQTPPRILFTSTNKVYGGMDEVEIEFTGTTYRYADGREGITEDTPLDFHSPYGCSKGAADQYVRDYSRIYGVPTVVFRMSCIYGRRQFGTEDQGWVAHFARSLLAGVPITIYGDGHQVRDILWVDDLVSAMRGALDGIDHTAGQIFNIGGGPGNAVSVRTVIDRLAEITGQRVPLRMAEWRPGDQRVYVTDTSRIEKALGWSPRTPWAQGLETLVEWLDEADFSTPVLPLHAEPRQAAGAAS